MDNLLRRHYGGWRKGIDDLRDFQYPPPRIFEPLPQKTDLAQFEPAIYDQGQLGSCVWNALGAAHSMLMHKDLGHSVNFSRLFGYYETRKVEGTINEDAGCIIRDAIKILVKLGNCYEYNWPYNLEKWNVEPEFGCYAQAEQYQILRYYRVNNSRIRDVIACLADGYAVVGGFAIYESFESDETEKNGVVPLPGWNESLLGGHAMAIVGHNDEKRQVKLRNSWGQHWGIAGYAWMPYEYITNTSLSSDFWTLRAGENV